MKKIEQDKLLEVAEPELFDGISNEQLEARKIAVARVLDVAEQALRDAEKQGKADIAEQLRERIAVLQDLLDRADETEVEDHDSDEDGGEDSGSGKTGESKGTSSSDEPEEKPDNEDSVGDKDTDGKSEKSETEDDKDGTGGGEGDEESGEEGNEDSSGDYKSSTTGSSSGGSSGSSSGNDDSSSSDSDSSSGKGKPKINPFEKRSGGGGKGDSEPPTHEEIFTAAKEILSKLAGEASRGAKDGIKNILATRGYYESFKKPLTEAAKRKTLATMTEDEFNAELSATMEIVDKIKKISYSDDLSDRIAKIKRETDNAVSRMELEKEDAIHTKASRSALKAYEKENNKYKKGTKLAGLDAFKNNLYRAVRDQVIAAEDDEETWTALNRRHEDDPSILKKGTRIEDVYDDEGIPTINVYFDQSGSWSSRDIEVGKSAIRVINEYHERGDINLQIFYMSAGGVFTDATAARAYGAAEGWADALKHIRESGVKNVIILSDSDLDYFEWSNRPTGNNGVTRIDGCVWWLWKNSDYSKKALKELIGKSGNYQYTFTSR